MTYEQINKLWVLRKLIQTNEERLKELEADLLPGIGRTDGMPRSGTAYNKLEDLTLRAIELKGLIHRHILDYYDEEIEIRKFIASVDDYIDRLILEIRFIPKGNSPRPTWRQIAFEIGGRNTPDAVRKRAFRLLEKSEKYQLPKKQDDT
jgi:hypothetical protein